MADAASKGRTRNQPRPGEMNPRSKLSESQVLAIRASTEKGVALASRYGVSKGTITDIRRGRTWPHLNTPKKEN